MAPGPRGRVAAAAIVAALGVGGAVGGTTTAVADPVSPPAITETDGASLQILSMSPQVAKTGDELVIRGEFVNTGSKSVPAPTVRLRGSNQPLVGRDSGTAWATGVIPDTALADWDTEKLSGDVGPGQSRTFTLTRTKVGKGVNVPYAVLPIEVFAGPARLTTFLPIHTRVEYTPLSLGIILPLTLAPDKRLVGLYGAARADAWVAETGAGGRLDSLLTGSAGLPITWAVDPTLLTPPAEIPKDRPTDPDAASAWDLIGPDQRREGETRRAFDGTLRAAMIGRETLLLPDADADLPGALGVPTAQPLVRTLVAAARKLAPTLPGTVRADIAWPADDLLSTERVDALARFFPPNALAAVIGSGGSLSVPGPQTAAHPTGDNRAVLAADDRLNAAFAGIENDPSGVRTGQRLLAESLLLLTDYPSTERTVLITGPRGLSASSAALTTAVGALAKAPWIAMADVSTLLANAPAGSTVQTKTPTGLTLPPGVQPDPAVTTRTPLRTSRFALMTRSLSAIDAVSEVRVDGAAQRDLWNTTLRQLTSSRWRADPIAFSAGLASLSTAGAQARTALTVTPETINFFADKGRLQVTATNTLDVALTGVRVELTPLTNRLRVDSQPSPITIGPGARASVQVRATALAAGRVPIRTTLYTPSGHPIGSSTTVVVRVYPTGAWIYWAIGGVGLLLLVIGLLRGRRRRQRRAAAG